VKIAVDVCVGTRGIKVLRAAGHNVVAIAEAAESDREWFARALAAGVELVIAVDGDIEILCYDNRVEFFRHRRSESGKQAAQRLVQRLARRS